MWFILFYITYEPIKQWAWSDVKQSKRPMAVGPFQKQVVISIPRKVGK